MPHSQKRGREDSGSESGSESDVLNLDDMTVAQLKEALRDSQVQKNMAEKKMRLALGDISNHDLPTPKQKKKHRPAKRRHIESSNDETDGEGGTRESAEEDRSGNESDDDKQVREKKVEGFGRNFVLRKGLWLKRGTLDAKIDPEYNVKKRFDGAERQGQLRDILDIIPDHYKGKVMRSGWFKHAFLEGMKSQRSNTSNRIRCQAGTAIYDCGATDLLTPASRRQFRKEIGWNGEEFASLDVPLLHKGESNEYDINTCFLSPVPMRLFVALIRGTKSAAAMLNPEETGVVTQKDNMERIHHIDHAEPGGIAAACTLAIWGKSMDVQLKARGETTNIDYEARFEEYLDILITGLREKRPSILHVFSEWDRIIFPNAEASHVDSGSKQKKRGKSDGYRRAMAAMREDEPQEEEGYEAEGENGGDDGGD